MASVLRVLGLVTHYDNRAGGVGNAVSAHRAEKHPFEGTMTAATDDEKIRAVGCVDEHLGRMSFHHVSGCFHGRYGT